MDIFDYYTKEELIRKLLSRTEKTDTCWNFIGQSHNRGYVQMELWKAGRKMIGVHRLSYMLFKGKIPIGLTIDHLCGTHACVNPDHLEPVTIKENTLRYHRQRTHCRKGHLYSEDNTGRHYKGYRMCKTCYNASRRKTYLAKRNGKLDRRGTKPTEFSMKGDIVRVNENDRIAQRLQERSAGFCKNNHSIPYGRDKCLGKGCKYS